MSLEKGISRIGTALGFMVGAFFVLVSMCFVGEMFGYFDSRQLERRSQAFIEALTSEKDSTMDFSQTPGHWQFLSDEEQLALEQTLSEKKEYRPPSDFLYVYLPTTISSIFLAIIPFFIGFYGTKGVAGTANWIIKGFRE